jgi:hypothetical protein
MKTPADASTAPPPNPSRDETATMTCPTCQNHFTPTGRQRYCGTSCRKTAFRRRHQNPPVTVAVPAAQPRRQITIYECPSCGERLLGEQRCEQCGTFTRRVGIGGPCPHCDGPVAVADLLDTETTITATTSPRKTPTASTARSAV